MRSRSGLYFPDDVRDPSNSVKSLFSGLPAFILDKIGDDPVKGDGGILCYFNHFDHWDGPVAEGSAAGWLLSGTTGVATVAISNIRSGEIVLTGDATGSANPTLALGTATLGANFQYLIGKRMWVAARMALGTVATTEVFLGVGTPDTSPTVTGTFPSDGIFFNKASTDTKLSFDARKDGTSTSKALISNTLADGAYSTIGFQVDRLGNILPFHDGVYLPAGLIPVGAANIPAAGADVMQPMIGILGASMTMKLDWVLFAQDI